MRYLLLLPLLAGCAGSSNGLYQRNVGASFQSAKEPLELSACISTAVLGTPTIVQSGSDHYTLLRSNGYGVPLVRYDVFKRDAVTVVEIRSNPNVGAMALDKVRNCL